MNNHSLLGCTVRGAALAIGTLLALTAQAAAPGITGVVGATATSKTFNLSATPMRVMEPNGRSVYGWGYGCTGAYAGGFAPAAIGATAGANCPSAQLPGPTLVVNQGDVVTVVLTNSLPAAAGATSMLFPGFQVTTAGGTTGLLTQEAPSAAACNAAANSGCNTVSYTFTASTPGTHSYYSGTQSDLQIEMGLFGAIVVLPTLSTATQSACVSGGHAVQNLAAESHWGESDFRLAQAAYDNPYACYDREYLFQFSEMDENIHIQAEQQVLADQAKTSGGCTNATGCLVVTTEPYVPNYFMVNGRSMPDDMDPNYAIQYPNQPYNGNPHMHPGELSLIRIIGQGRWQHPFHEHANHLRLLARDGNQLLSDPTLQLPAGPLLFTTTTTPGMTLDGIFYWTGKGLNWDAYGHGYAGDPSVCFPDANGYFTVDQPATATTAAIVAANQPNFYEWCGDHNKALEKNPFGQVASGGPMTLPDPNIVVNGAWYAGSPYLGPDATARAQGATPLPPFGTTANSPSTEAGFAYMWHSHNEREITTDNIFPGGMMMMMLVDPRGFVIDETN